MWAHSSMDRALVYGTSDEGSTPSVPNQGPLAQLAAAWDLKSLSYGFESRGDYNRPGDGIGIRACFRNMILWVRVPPRLLTLEKHHA